ncbi:MAG: hypothetical protein ACXVIM_07095 [Acidimicrobiia bacterium]
MATAGDLAELARFASPPNPWVGCVIVRDGEIVGRGATGPYPGGLHAEAAALREAGTGLAGRPRTSRWSPATTRATHHHARTRSSTRASAER